MSGQRRVFATARMDGIGLGDLFEQMLDSMNLKKKHAPHPSTQPIIPPFIHS
jgi:hypothetical protein